MFYIYVYNIRMLFKMEIFVNQKATKKLLPESENLPPQDSLERSQPSAFVRHIKQHHKKEMLYLQVLNE